MLYNGQSPGNPAIRQSMIIIYNEKFRPSPPPLPFPALRHLTKSVPDRQPLHIASTQHRLLHGWRRRCRLLGAGWGRRGRAFLEAANAVQGRRAGSSRDPAAVRRSRRFGASVVGPLGARAAVGAELAGGINIRIRGHSGGRSSLDAVSTTDHILAGRPRLPLVRARRRLLSQLRRPFEGRDAVQNRSLGRRRGGLRHVGLSRLHKMR